MLASVLAPEPEKKHSICLLCRVQPAHVGCCSTLHGAGLAHIQPNLCSILSLLLVVGTCMVHFVLGICFRVLLLLQLETFVFALQIGTGWQ